MPSAMMSDSVSQSASMTPVGVPDITRRRLAAPGPDDGWRSWLAAGAVAAVAAVVRLVGLGHPKGQIFDEVYYAVDARNLLRHGVEWDDKAGSAAYVVHPPLGKWLIGLGQEAFGYNEFGWRISAAIAGVLSVLLVTRLARRLFRSTVLGCAAGLLMAFDGFQVVLSRTALLDIFLLLFILAAFTCLVLDRDQRRLRWLRALEKGHDPAAPGRAGRPSLGVPWWRLAAGVMTGCAMAVKWSALWYILLFVLLIYLWEAGARKSAGAARCWRDTMLRESGWVAVFGLVIVVVYLASWTGWFVTDHGWDRHWLASQGRPEPPIFGALANLFHYHESALHFHTTLDKGHPYQSWPWQWLLLGRPVAFFYNGDGPCAAPSCSAEVLLLGTPLLWWSFIPALGALAWFSITRRDWRASAIGLGALAGFVPWFAYALEGRTMFYFYIAPAEPFLILAVVYAIGALAASPLLRGAKKEGSTRVPMPLTARLVLAAAYIVLVTINFAYFYPIYVGEPITYDQWQARMWLGSRWI